MCVIHNNEKEYIGEDRYLLNFQSEYGIFMFYLDLYTWLISGKQSNGSPLINIVIILQTQYFLYRYDPRH